jgi:hypothetical protein
MPARHSPASAGLLPAFAALALLAGCTGDAAPADAARETAAVVSEGAGEAGQMAALPAYLPPYPGAEVVARITGSSEAAAGGNSASAVLILRSPDPVAKIMRFYDVKAREVGIAPSMQIDDEGDSVRMYADSRLGQGSLVAVSRDESGKSSEIVISVGGGEVAVATNTPPQPRDSKLTAFADVRLQ